MKEIFTVGKKTKDLNCISVKKEEKNLKLNGN